MPTACSLSGLEHTWRCQNDPGRPARLCGSQEDRCGMFTLHEHETELSDYFQLYNARTPRSGRKHNAATTKKDFVHCLAQSTFSTSLRNTYQKCNHIKLFLFVWGLFQCSFRTRSAANMWARHTVTFSGGHFHTCGPQAPRCVSVEVRVGQSCVSDSDVAVGLLQRNVDADWAETGRRAVASAKPPRTTAPKLEQTQYSFSGQIKWKCYSRLYPK